jgi:chemotaxis protein methyltransferase CheR
MEMLSGSWDYAQFKAAFYQKTGLDLDCYKDRQMERRIRQLMQRERKPDFHLFYQYLADSPPAMEYFFNYLTINTSEFFRDEKVYARLKEEIFPELLKNYPESLTVWSAGCSIGAEPYTVAIILDSLKVLDRAQIIATDMDDKALLTAQKGCYDLKYVQKTPEEHIHRYFDREGEKYCLKTEIKKKVIFKRHNLLVDAPVSGCLMILCRNVFIYFKAETQDFLLERFSRVLKPGGILVIGSAEYISNPGKFGFFKRYNTIYQKKTGSL